MDSTVDATRQLIQAITNAKRMVDGRWAWSASLQRTSKAQRLDQGSIILQQTVLLASPLTATNSGLVSLFLLQLNMHPTVAKFHGNRVTTQLQFIQTTVFRSRAWSVRIINNRSPWLIMRTDDQLDTVLETVYGIQKPQSQYPVRSEGTTCTCMQVPEGF